MPDKVKCADCGFLAVRHYQTRQLLDPESAFRKSGTIPVVTVAINNHALVYDEVPVCFVRKVDFIDKSEMAESHPSESQRRLVMHKERSCEDFTPWIQGFTPREHKEMLLSEKALEIKRAEQAADRAWREAQAAREHTWRQEDLERDRKWRNEDRSLAMSNLVLAALVAAVSVIATLVAAKLLPWFSGT